MYNVSFVINRIDCILAAMMFVNHPFLSICALSEIPLIKRYQFLGGFKVTLTLLGGKYSFALLIEEVRE